MNGITARIKKDPIELSYMFHQVGARWEGTIYEPELDCAGLELQTFRTVTNKFLLFIHHSVCGISF